MSSKLSYYIYGCGVGAFVTGLFTHLGGLLGPLEFAVGGLLVAVLVIVHTLYRNRASRATHAGGEA